MLGKAFSHYRIIEKLGSGGMGDVYVAENLHLKNRVALKFLPPHLSRDEQAKKRFIQEAQSASALNHPNVCTIYDIDEGEDGQLFMAMALYEGHTLKEKLAAGALPIDEALEITRQIGEGLAAAHEKGIIHRDIKPANIFITEKGRAVILDFGLAKLQESTAILTESGSTLGTAAYMSPEQARGEVVDHRTDIWSLSVVLYEMLTGGRPFEADYQQALVYQILNEEPTPIESLLPGVPPPLAELIRRGLSKEIRGRLSDTGRFTRLDRSDLDLPIAKAARERFWPRVIAFTSIVVVSLLIGLYFGVLDGDVRPEARSAFAVLPFTVEGDENLEYLETGMVNLLSARLNALPRLRSIDPNALFSKIDREAYGRMTVEDGISISRNFEADGFILGSVIRVGGPIVLRASLYKASGELISDVSETVRSDTLVLSGIDRLSMQLLADRLEAEGEQIKALATVTTDSFRSLREYLKGERLLAQHDIEGAYDAFSNSVALDSTFALAWYRLSYTAGWMPVEIRRETRGYALAALRHGEDLPSSTRDLLRAGTFFYDGMADEARRLVLPIIKREPENAWAWSVMGEIEWHLNPLEGRSSQDAKPYLQRALELNSEFMEAKRHLVHIAVEQHDFIGAKVLAEDLGSGFDTFEIDFVLAESDKERQRMADSIIASETREIYLSRHYEMLIYYHRPDLAAILREAMPKDEVAIAGLRRMAEAMSGRIDAYLPDARPSTLAFYLRMLLPFYPTNPVELASYSEKLEAADVRLVDRHFSLGLLSWRLRHVEGIEEAVRNLTSVADTAAAACRPCTSYSATLSALSMWLEGDASGSLDAIERARYTFPPGFGAHADQTIARYLRAETLLQVGRVQEAAQWYQSVWSGGVNIARVALTAPSLRRLGQCYYQLGDTDRAIHYYTRFIDLWQDADERLQPWVQEARESLDRLVEEQAREPR